MADDSQDKQEKQDKSAGQDGATEPWLAARQSRLRGNVQSLVSVMLVLAIYAMVNYLGFKYFDRWDVSPSKLYALSGKTTEMLRRLPEPVTITTYFTQSTESPALLSQEIIRLIEEYKAKGGGKIKARNIDPVKDFEEARALARELNFGPEENLVIFQYGDRKTAVPEERLGVVQRSPLRQQEARLISFDGEAVFTSTIQALVEGKPSVVYFLTGHGEMSLEDASSFDGAGKVKPFLKRDNIDLRELNMLEVGDIPEDADALVVIGPRQSLASFEVEAIAAYLERNGKLLLLQGPDTTSGLESILPQYGLRLANDIVRAQVDLGGRRGLTGQILGVQFSDHPAVRSLQGFNLPLNNARSIFRLPTPDGQLNNKVAPLMVTPKSYWGETNLQDPGARFDANADIPGPLMVAAAYDGGTVETGEVEVAGTRLVLVGVTEFLANRFLTGVGLDFFLNSLDWMLEKKLAVGIAPKEPTEFPIAITPLQMRVIAGILAVVIPVLVLFLGGILWYTRRN